MYDELTHNRNIYFDFIFVSHMIHVQHQNGNGIVRDGKITGGEWSRVAKMTGVEMSGMGIFQNSDDMMINMLMMQFNM